MSGSKSITLRQYYRSFISISGLMACMFSAIPLFSKALPERYGDYIFPPLGSIEGPARIGAVTLALAATFFAFFTRRKHVTSAILLAFVWMFLYLGLFLRFVRNIEIPSRAVSVQVSVGYDRTVFATAVFGNASDWEMLRERGTDEEEIWRLWTTKSLVVSRLSLFITYAFFISFMVAAFSWGVLHELAESSQADSSPSTHA